MIDLSEMAGIDVGLNPSTGSLWFGKGVAVEGIGARTFGELVDVLAHPAAISDPDAPAYLLYRGVHRHRDAPLLAEHGLRYDLTVTLPGDVGGELTKTAGHIHSHAPDGVGFPEIFDVLHGRAAFVLQFADPLRVVIAVCERGERILIPPDASHLTVNIGDEPVVVADLVAIESRNAYGDFREKRGAAVYLFRDPASSIGFGTTLNEQYGRPAEARIVRGSQIGSFVPESDPLYSHFGDNSDRYQYLTAPAAYAAEMRALWSAEE